MTIFRPDIYDHNNPNLPFTDVNSVGGADGPVADQASMLAFPPDKLKVGTRKHFRVGGVRKEYELIDLDFVNDLALGWEEIETTLDAVLTAGNTSTQDMTINNLTLTGNLTVQGNSVIVDAEITTTDAVLDMNYGEVGAGVTLGYSGLNIERGTLDNFWLGFDEVRDAFTIGQITELSAAQIATTQLVATREDTPLDGGHAVWNSANNRFETVSVSSFSYWTQSGNDIYYNTGYVGIGTSSPSRKLTIANTDGTEIMFKMVSREGTQNNEIALGVGRQNLADAQSYLAFYTHDNVALTRRMSLNYQGDLGIGVGPISIAYRLHVEGTNSLASIRNSTTTNGIVLNNTGNLTVHGDSTFMGGATINGVLSTIVDVWHTSTDGAERLFFANNGIFYFRSPNSFYWRNSTNTTIAIMTDAGRLDLSGILRAQDPTAFTLGNLAGDNRIQQSSSIFAFFSSANTLARVRGSEAVNSDEFITKSQFDAGQSSDTLQAVTDRGSVTTNGITINSGANTGLNITSSNNLIANFTSSDAIGEIRIADNTSYTRLLTTGVDFKIMPNNGVELAVFEGDTNSVIINGSLSLGKDGSGNTILSFYDDTNNTQRSLQWTDASSKWQVEDSTGTLRDLIHSANINSFVSGFVPTSRSLTGGDGINTIGDLSADRTVSVDSTVARKNINNNFTVAQQFLQGARINNGFNLDMAATTTGRTLIRFRVASATDPAYSFGGDEDSGYSWSAADTLELVTGGVSRLQISSTTITSSLLTGIGTQMLVVNASGVLSRQDIPSGGGLSNLVDDTTPQLGGQLDVNGQSIGDGTRELLSFVEDASAVNHIEIENNATGSAPIIRSTGDDTNVNLTLDTKGTGTLTLGMLTGTGTQMLVLNASGVASRQAIPTLSSLGGVATTTTLTGGDGIGTIGDLSTNRTIAVDSTVARKNADNAFTAIQSFNASGSVTSPTISIGASNIGIYDITNGMGFTTGGIQRLSIDNNGIVASGTITATNFIDSSDSRLKYELDSPVLGLSLIRKLNPKFYRKGAVVESGFYADQLPENAHYMRHIGPDRFFGMDYKNLHAVTVMAIKEVDGEVDKLKDRVNKLEEENARLREQIKNAA